MKSYRAKIDIDADGRYDVTPIFTDRVAFKDLINDLVEPFLAMEFDCVVGIDQASTHHKAARDGPGFVIAGCWAHVIENFEKRRKISQRTR